MRRRSMAAPINIPVIVFVAERVLRSPSIPSLSKYCSYASFPLRAISTLVMDLNSPALIACSICARRSVEIPAAAAETVGQSLALCPAAAVVRKHRTIAMANDGNPNLICMLFGRAGVCFGIQIRRGYGTQNFDGVMFRLGCGFSVTHVGTGHFWSPHLTPQDDPTGQEPTKRLRHFHQHAIAHRCSRD